MAWINQGASSINNCTKMLLSFWAYIPGPRPNNQVDAPSGGFPGEMVAPSFTLFEWGGYPAYSGVPGDRHWVLVGEMDETATNIDFNGSQIPSSSGTHASGTLDQFDANFYQVGFLLNLNPPGTTSVQPHSPVYQCQWEDLPSELISFFLTSNVTVLGNYLNVEIWGGAISFPVEPGFDPDAAFNGIDINMASGVKVAGADYDGQFDWVYDKWHHILMAVKIPDDGRMVIPPDIADDPFTGVDCTLQLVLDDSVMVGGTVTGRTRSGSMPGTSGKQPGPGGDGIVVHDRPIYLSHNYPEATDAFNGSESATSALWDWPQDRRRRYANFQCWFGPSDDNPTIDNPTLVDPSAFPPDISIESVRRNFIDVQDNPTSGGPAKIGNPAPPSKAIRVYGKPHLEFKGGSKAFIKDTGTDGVFTKTGTIKDTGMPKDIPIPDGTEVQGP